MHESGWVHRDISSGNILIVDDIVKITDLEYAKNMKDDSSHSERSVCSFFIFITYYSSDVFRVPLCSCPSRRDTTNTNSEATKRTRTRMPRARMRAGMSTNQSLSQVSRMTKHIFALFVIEFNRSYTSRIGERSITLLVANWLLSTWCAAHITFPRRAG